MADNETAASPAAETTETKVYIKVWTIVKTMHNCLIEHKSPKLNNFLIEMQASPTPIFGSASTFGAGTGFGGFTGLAAQPKEEDGEAGEGEEAEAAPEEECKAEFKPIVQLDEVEVSTGEEEEDNLFDV